MAPSAQFVDLCLEDSPEPSPPKRRHRRSIPARKPADAEVCIISDGSDDEIVEVSRKKKRIDPPSSRVKTRNENSSPFGRSSECEDGDLLTLEEIIKASATKPKPLRPKKSLTDNNGARSRLFKGKRKGCVDKFSPSSVVKSSDPSSSRDDYSESTANDAPCAVTFKPDPSPYPELIRGPQRSERAASLLARLDTASETIVWDTPPRPRLRKSSGRTSQTDTVSSTLSSARPLQYSASAGTSQAKTKTSKPKLTEAERARAKAAKEAAKALEKEQKRKEKEAKAAEKAREKQKAAALAEVNRRQVNKDSTTVEMILDIPASLKGTSFGIHIDTFMQNLQVSVSDYAGPVLDVFRWRRKVTARYNEALGYWEPCRETIEEENNILLWLPAEYFVARAVAEASPSSSKKDGSDTLTGLVTKIKTNYPGKTLMVMIEGLEAWQRKNRNIANRAYTAAVAGTQAPPPTSKTGKNKSAAPQIHIDPEAVESALLILQITHGLITHHTSNESDSAAWLAKFTQQISQIPYAAQKHSSHSSTNFCMDVGQIKTGASTGETYVLLLQEIVRVTPNVAYGIEAEYPSLPELIRGLRSHGPLALQDILKTNVRNGMPGRDRIGPSISKRVYKIFMSEDPGSYDV